MSGVIYWLAGVLRTLGKLHTRIGCDVGASGWTEDQWTSWCLCVGAHSMCWYGLVWGMDMGRRWIWIEWLCTSIGIGVDVRIIVCTDIHMDMYRQSADACVNALLDVHGCVLVYIETCGTRGNWTRTELWQKPSRCARQGNGPVGSSGMVEGKGYGCTGNIL